MFQSSSLVSRTQNYTFERLSISEFDISVYLKKGYRFTVILYKEFTFLRLFVSELTFYRLSKIYFYVSAFMYVRIYVSAFIVRAKNTSRLVSLTILTTSVESKSFTRNAANNIFVRLDKELSKLLLASIVAILVLMKKKKQQHTHRN